MDPRIQDAAAIIQKLMEALSMAVEEIQNLKNTQQDSKKNDNGSMNKQASFVDTDAIARELCMPPHKVPEFLKHASIEQFNTLRDTILSLNSSEDMTKIASVGFGNDDDFDLNATILSIAQS